jgi:hypothetical protein
MRFGLAATALLLALIETAFEHPILFGSWQVIFYLLLFSPLVVLIVTKRTINPYTKWFVPILFILLFDRFYYNNDFVTYALPVVLFLLSITLYLTAMKPVAHIYQTLIPSLAPPFNPFVQLHTFFTQLVSQNYNRALYMRIAIAATITIPFLVLFMALFIHADSNFAYHANALLSFHNPFEPHNLLSTPLAFIGYLLLFIYGFVNHPVKVSTPSSKKLDTLIVGIFLGVISLLFFTFILTQLAFLIQGDTYLRTGSASTTNPATFAREGFFQLMWVMGIVLVIYLFIMKRFKGERIVTLLMSTLIIETLLIGIVSLKKMHLYQSLKGATVLRYYVEWFDYFLIAILLFGLLCVIKRTNFHTVLNFVSITALLALTLIASINVDHLVAEHNIDKFKNTPEKLDRHAIATKLSIDALPAIQQEDIVLQLDHLRNCNWFSLYHLGYCSLIARYGTQQIEMREW